MVSASLGAGWTSKGLSVGPSSSDASLIAASFADWSEGMKVLSVST
jgi:hypothetical protein